MPKKRKEHKAMKNSPSTSPNSAK